MRIARRATALAVGITLLSLVPLTAAQAVITNKDRASWAAGFIAVGQKKDGSIPAFSQVGSTADAVVALVATRRGPINIKRGIVFLRGKVTEGAIDGNVGLTAKVLLAVSAAGKDPRTFGGHNLITDITSTLQPDGRYGVYTAVFDQAYAMLALSGAGDRPPANARTWLSEAQCADGGWQYDGPQAIDEDEHCLSIADPFGDWFQADTNTSALAVMALEASDGPTPVQSPFTFFTDIRDADYGGWGYTWGYNQTDANSTSLVIQAYAAGDRALPAGAMGALRTLQYGKCGGFAYGWTGTSPTGVRTGPDLGATIGAVQGLLRKPLPIAAVDVTQSPAAPIGCP